MAKIGKKRGIALLAAAAVIAAAGFGFGNRKSDPKTAEDYGISQETVQAGEISKVVSGTGSLAADDSVSVSIPVGTKVLEIYVEDGDFIKEGDRIAKLDALSLREIVISLDESIEAQEKAIDDLDTSEKNYNEKLAIAQAALSDLKNSRASASALAEDPVLLSDKTGIISGINMKEGEKVTQSMSGGGNSGSLDTNLLSGLLLGRADSGPAFHPVTHVLVSQGMKEDEAGTLSEDSGNMTSAKEAPVEFEAGDESPASQGADQTESSAAEAQTDAENQAGAEESRNATDSGMDPAGGASSGQDADDGQNTQPADPDPATGEEPAVVLTKLPFQTITLRVKAPAAGETPQDAIALPDQSHIRANMIWLPAQEQFAGGAVYLAVIALQAEEGYCFPAGDDVPKLTIDSCSNARIGKYDTNGDGYPDTLIAICPYVTAGDASGDSDLLSRLNQAAEEEVTNLRKILETQIEELIKSTAGSAKSGVAEVLGGLGSDLDFGGLDLSSLTGSAFSSMDLSGLSGLSGGDLGSLSGLSGLASSGSAASSYYETAALWVIPVDRVYLDINIDEMDINTLAVGQKAQIGVDAIPGADYTGEIIRIANTKNNETSLTGNSSAKYTVRIAMPWEEQMKFGMSASAKITVETREDVVRVPIDAVMVLGGEDVVYTSFDAEGQLADPVPVTTGLSDGSMVEILGGLQAGDTICYISTQYESLFSQFETVELE